MSWDKRERRGEVAGMLQKETGALEKNGKGEEEGGRKRKREEDKARAAWRSENKGVTAEGGRGRRGRAGLLDGRKGRSGEGGGGGGKTEIIG